MKKNSKVDKMAVYELLNKRGWNWRDLAEELGISSPYLFDLASGNRNADAYIPRIAKILNVKTEAITLRSCTPEVRV